MSIVIGSSSCIVWFTGLSGAGKTTIAGLAADELNAHGYKSFLLDGDLVRNGLSSDLGFSAIDRRENLRRACEVAAILADAGLIVLAAFITPLDVDRQRIRSRLVNYPFIEAFVSTPLELAEKRDPKGLYRRARRGEISDFTGIDSKYEEPVNSELRLDTLSTDAMTLARSVVRQVLLRVTTKTVASESEGHPTLPQVEQSRKPV